ncbi:MAG: AAA domain-containing protein, partial [Syntrophales bacterium]
MRQISEQPWRLWLKDLPDHSSIRRGRIPESPTKNEQEDETDTTTEVVKEDTFLLQVRRPKLTSSPPPPNILEPWLRDGWDNPFLEVTVNNSLNNRNEKGETELIRFEADPDRIKALQSWKIMRDEWAENERPAREAMKVFERFYELYSRIGREAERVELVLGEGLLNWRRPDGGIHHPILLQRIQLEFNTTNAEFTVTETEDEVELYSALLQTLGDGDGLIGQCEKELSEKPCHPLSEASSSILRSLAIRLSVHGKYIGYSELKGEEDHPRIARAPVFFLRSRTMGFAAAIDNIIKDIQSGKELPNSLIRVVGIDTSEDNNGNEKDTRQSYFEPQEVLFSKPSNSEQFQIAERLARHSSVLVQGPPGTGKSHTIANLIGHTLAEGKTVLVTSHTTKALSVLHDHVVPELQGLCVSVLESDKKGHSQLETSIKEITKDRNREELKKDAVIQDGRRKKILDHLKETRRRLQEARENEYSPIVIGGVSFPPSEAARIVNQKKESDDWLPGPIALGAVLSLTSSEVSALHRTNGALSPDNEKELSGPLPTITVIPSPGEYEHLVIEWQQLSAEDREKRRDLWNGDLVTSSYLENLNGKIRDAISIITDDDSWRLAAISAGRLGGQNLEPWNNILLLLDKVCKQAAVFQEAQFRHAPVIHNDMAFDEQQAITDEIIQHLKKSGSLSKIKLACHPKWKRLISSAATADGTLKTLEHFLALKEFINLTTSRRELCGRWDRMLGILGAPLSTDLSEDIENTYVQFRPIIHQCLNWYNDIWEPIERSLTEAGFQCMSFLSEQPPNLSPFGELLRLREAVTGALQPILASRLAAAKLAEVDSTLSTLEKNFRTSWCDERPTPVATAFQEALEQRDIVAYCESFQHLEELQRLKADYDLRRALLAKLEPFAPGWADAIRHRQGIHADSATPGEVAQAWLWRQLNDELDRRGQVSLYELQKSIEKLEDELRIVTTDLVNRRAWFHQSGRIGLSEQQALQGWLLLNSKITKTGIRAPQLKRAARDAMSKSRSAVPVWIMPLARVVENFDPRHTRFDVVIIDEASQCDVMGLIAFYLGKKVVVVGDEKQVSPLAIGQKLEFVDKIIKEWLQGIPYAELYDGKTSVYDLARMSARVNICLLEHFRCAPEIIQFSNNLCYEGKIQPLRDPGTVLLKPSVISYRVSGGVCENKVNMEEAWTVASLVVSALEQPEYQGKTFGVITLLGDEQAFKIDEILRNHRFLNPAIREQARVLCGNAAHFQGDERNVIFLTLVDTPNPNGTPLSIRRESMYEQRFNVAASRAKDQMWVIHSLNPARDLKDGDLRRRLIEYVEDPGSAIRALERDEKQAESDFEKEVLRRLVREGYRVHPQWKVGSYRIDMVVEGVGQKRLAVECDGDRYHTFFNRDKDMARQAVLERLGWRFVRIRGTNFFRNPEKAMKPVYDRLEQYGITRHLHDTSMENNEDNLGKELKERVIRRAQELRNEWRASQHYEEDDQNDINQQDEGPQKTERQSDVNKPKDFSDELHNHIQKKDD